MDKGWIKIYRKLSDNPIWKAEPFTRGQAWIDLILLANHKDSYFFLRDHKIFVKRGQVGWSQKKLSSRWKWSRTKIKNFLKMLEIEQQLTVKKSHSTSIITILNYHKYQEKEQQECNRKATEKQQKSNRSATEKQQEDTNKNDKNDKNDKKNIYRPKKKEDPYKQKVKDILNTYSNNLIDCYNEFLKMRIKIKKPMTDYAKYRLLKKLDTMVDNDTDKIVILTQSIEKSWSDIYPVKNNYRYQAHLQNTEKPKAVSDTEKIKKIKAEILANGGEIG